jgi:hypothetical protein
LNTALYALAAIFSYESRRGTGTLLQLLDKGNVLGEHNEVLQTGIGRIVLYVLIANLSIDIHCPSKHVSDAYERGSDAIYLVQYVIFIPAFEHFEHCLVPGDLQTVHISSTFVVSDMVGGMFEVGERRKNGFLSLWVCGSHCFVSLGR